MYNVFSLYNEQSAVLVSESMQSALHITLILDYSLIQISNLIGQKCGLYLR